MKMRSSYTPDRDDKSVEHMQRSQSKSYESQLFPAQHPTIQPVGETPETWVWVVWHKND